MGTSRFYFDDLKTGWNEGTRSTRTMRSMTVRSNVRIQHIFTGLEVSSSNRNQRSRSHRLTTFGLLIVIILRLTLESLCRHESP